MIFLHLRNVNMKKTKFYIFLKFGLLITILVPQILSASLPVDADKPENNKRLFVIARSKNANLICYDLNYIAPGKLDPEKPIHVYWFNQTDKPGTTDELSYIQAKMAYGYTANPAGTSKWEISLVAFPQRKLILEKAGEGIYRSRIIISGRQAVLKKIYVQADPNNSLRVQWVDVFGIDMQTGKEVKERIIP
ncbi:MAG: hypothetical protein PWR20_1811 [Bacteroidales bacterium]|jgi:hypothetical protein|nr:hypothetical protein [Bacteroidales bacterium]MDN5330647.1 hypothetical protein [Bacteroidales bacterium]